MLELTKLTYKPDRVSAPGDSLADILEERGMTQAELAERTGRPLKTINEIVKGKAAITPETAIQLERVLGTPADFWNQREANYRVYLARVKESENLESQKKWLDQFPVKEMKARGWISDCGTTVTEQMICVLNFFGVASPEQWEAGWTKRRLAFRKAMNLNTDGGATAVWLRRGEIEGEAVTCRPFDREKLVSSLSELRALTKEKDPAVFIPKLQQICADCGVAIVFVKGFKNVPAYGASCWLNPEKALIQLSVRGKKSDLLWFTIFHEIGHVLKHSKKEIFVELQGDNKQKSEEENEADQFAADVLLPQKAVDIWLASGPSLDEAGIKAFATDQGIDAGIVVGRLQHMKLVGWKTTLHKLKTSYVWAD